MQISKDGITFLKRHEGIVPFAYLDQTDNLTIGIGHLCLEFDFYCFDNRLNYLTEDAIKNQQKFKEGYILRNGRRYFFEVRTSPKVKEITQLTNYQLEYIFKKDIQKFVDTINDTIRRPLKQNQFDALVSLCYNIGREAFKNSTLLEKINNGLTNVEDDFLKYKFSGDKELQVLKKRRSDEYNLFKI